MIKTTIHFPFFVMWLLVSFPGFSQARFGLTGGGAISSVLFSSKIQVDQAWVSHADIQKPVSTYYGGVIFHFKAGKKFVVKPGIEYFKKAWEVEANDKGRISTFRFLRRYDINYLQLPVLLSLTTSLGNGKVYVGAGPYAAFAINGSVKVDKEIFDLEFKKHDEPIYTYLPGDNYKPVQFINHFTINRIDYGFRGNMGYEFNFGLFLEAGVDMGVQQVSTSLERYDIQWNRTIRDPSSNVKFSIFHVGTGWMFNFK